MSSQDRRFRNRVAGLLAGVGTLFSIAQCERLPQVKLDVTNMSVNSSYISLAIWKLGSKAPCTPACEDTNQNPFAYALTPKADDNGSTANYHYKIGLNVASNGSGVQYQAAVTSWVKQSDSYCLADGAPPLRLGPFSTTEYFSEVSVPMTPLEGVEVTPRPWACRGTTDPTTGDDKQVPLIASVQLNISAQLNSMGTMTGPPGDGGMSGSPPDGGTPDATMTISGWYFRPTSQVKLQTIDRNGTASNVYSTAPDTAADYRLEMEQSAPNLLVIGLTGTQFEKLRGADLRVTVTSPAGDSYTISTHI